MERKHLSRVDEAPDGDFYAQPRFVHHIDDYCIAALKEFYERMLPKGGSVLDMMSSWTSHLADGAGADKVAPAAPSRCSKDPTEKENKQNPRLPASTTPLLASLSEPTIWTRILTQSSASTTGSGLVSHSLLMQADGHFGRVALLGMNDAELQANPAAHEYHLRCSPPSRGWGQVQVSHVAWAAVCVGPHHARNSFLINVLTC